MAYHITDLRQLIACSSIMVVMAMLIMSVAAHGGEDNTNMQQPEMKLFDHHVAADSDNGLHRLEKRDTYDWLLDSVIEKRGRSAGDGRRRVGVPPPPGCIPIPGPTTPYILPSLPIPMDKSGFNVEKDCNLLLLPTHGSHPHPGTHLFPPYILHYLSPNPKGGCGGKGYNLIKF